MRLPMFAVGLALMVWPFAVSDARAQDVSSFKLDNGLQVVVIEDHRAPVVVHMVWYRAGAADEKPGVSGIAHFLEHLLFKATDNMESGELSATVAANGGSDNAFTTQDYTAYFQRVAADRLGLMMKMEADRMRHLKLTQEDIQTERQVILEERNMRIENNPGALFGEQRRAAQYLNSPYGIPVIGWKHEMEALSRADALDFYKTYYAPNDAIVVVAGDVEPENVLALAKQYYGPLAPTADLPVRSRPQEPPQRSERRLTYTDPRVAQPYVTRSYLAPERNHGDQKEAAALELLAQLLGGNATTSYLARKLQFEEKKAIYTGAFYSGVSLDKTTFDFTVVLSEGVDPQEGEDALDAALAAFLRDGVDSAELDRIKMQLRADLIYEQDDVQSLAQRYGAALTSGLTIEDVKAWPDVLQSVSEQDIMAAAKRLLDRRHAVTGWLLRPAATPVSQPVEEVTQ